VNGTLLAVAPVGITNYVVPDGVTTVSADALRWGPSIKSITIPEGVTKINDLAFSGLGGVTNISLPNSLTDLRQGAFSFCPSLNSFSGKYSSSDGKCLIDAGRIIAFASAGMTEYVVPESVTEIGSYAFAQLSSGSPLTQITLPGNLQSIGYRSFDGCCYLTEITIPSAVSYIDTWAFAGCSGLTQITVNALTPFTIGESVFKNTGNCPIYVPNESVDAYKAADGWSAYAERIFGIDVNGSVVGPDPQNPD
jgi:hypothetical protein